MSKDIAGDRELVAVTNRHLCEGELTECLKRICEAGFTRIILREKDMAEAEYRKLAEAALKVTEPYPVKLTLHTFLDTALLLGQERIHLPLPLLKKYTISEDGVDKLSRFAEIGSSVHSLAELSEVVACLSTERITASGYVTAGHVFATDCKKGIPGRGLSFLREIVAASSYPVYALGGIGPEQTEEVFATGVAGVCMMSYCMRL